MWSKAAWPLVLHWWPKSPSIKIHKTNFKSKTMIQQRKKKQKPSKPCAFITSAYSTKLTVGVTMKCFRKVLKKTLFGSEGEENKWEQGMKNSSLKVADFTDGIDPHSAAQKPFNWWMWTFKRIVWVITSAQEVAVLLPLCIPPSCDFTHVCTPGGAL